MPEGDTVFRAARRIDAALAGRLLTGTDFRLPSLATSTLVGHTVRGTRTHGKHLLTDFISPDGGDPLTLHTHLKMEGTWLTYRIPSPWRRPEHTARVVLASGDRQAVGFSLGVVELIDQRRVEEITGRLGPDLLAPDFDAHEAARRLTASGDLPFVQAVQDQRLMAGLGNMYSCELAFLTGMHPRRPLAQTSDLDRVITRARLLLEQNVRRATQSTTGSLAPGRRTWVYRQRQCARCSTSIAVDSIGPPGKERTTYWCPRCQPEG